MSGLLGTGRRIVNRLLSPCGVEVQVLNRGTKDLSAYEETARPASPVYLNIGAGSFYHPYWHNLDSPNEYYREAQAGNLHIQYDLRSHRPMPISDGSLKVAYTSHVIEHISDDDVRYLFGEVHRCLKPGGYFRVTCPDMDVEYAAYQRGDAGFWKWPNAYGVYNTSIEQCFLDHFATALTLTHPGEGHEKLSDEDVRRTFDSLPKEAAFDAIISQLPKVTQADHFGDHINWFNTEKVIRMLRDAGFSDVWESRYGQSQSPVLRNTVLFDATCPELSLYVECRKD